MRKLSYVLLGVAAVALIAIIALYTHSWGPESRWASLARIVFIVCACLGGIPPLTAKLQRAGIAEDLRLICREEAEAAIAGIENQNRESEKRLARSIEGVAAEIGHAIELAREESRLLGRLEERMATDGRPRPPSPRRLNVARDDATG